MKSASSVAPKTDTPAMRQMPKREQVFMRTGLIRVMYDASEMDDYLESILAAERASRLQAEEALREIKDRSTGGPIWAIANSYLSKPSVSSEQAEERQ